MFSVRYLPTLPSLLLERGKPLIHRDLSWLQFNERVLAEARASSRNPLLERAKFLAISATNLDEFFMIRVASLERALAALRKSSPSGYRNSVTRMNRIRNAILESVAKFSAKQAEVLDILTSELDNERIHIVRGAREGDLAFDLGKQVFESEILPKLLAPQVYQLASFQELENLQLSVLFPNGAWFRIPKTLSNLYRNESAGTPGKGPEHWLFFLDDLLLTHLGPSSGIQGQPGVVRITRDSDITVDLEEEDSESVPDIIRSGLRTREGGKPVRLQYLGNVSQDLLGQCAPKLKLGPRQIFPAPGTLCLQGLWTGANSLPDEVAEKTGIRYAALSVGIPAPLRDPSSIFEKLKTRDYLLHHPYDSFDAYVSWIRAACDDPKVESIEQTAYRMDAASPIIDALKCAAVAGKKVRVLIEPRARFDELNNLRLADELRKSGVEVSFGLGRLKVHAKIALITRREDGEARMYSHLSTGNYSAAAARGYTDLAILTSNANIGADARVFFDACWSGKVPQNFKTLLSAPTRLHRRLLALIHNETEAARAGRKARILAKVNALVDPAVIESLYRASQAGVQVDLVVRGACSLIPGIKGVSENIRVVSIVDRFLEHSRIYYFESARAMYLSSADWMPRNFFSRLEIAFPVLDPRIYSYLRDQVLPLYTGANMKCHELTSQGTWKKRSVRYGSAPTRAQVELEKFALADYRGTPLDRPI